MVILVLLHVVSLIDKESIDDLSEDLLYCAKFLLALSQF